MALKSTITAPAVVDGVSQVNSNGDTIIASPVILVDSNGEFITSLGGSGGSINLTETNTLLGDNNSPVASTDTGNFSINSLIKKINQSFTILLSRFPSLSNGKIPVDTGLYQPLTDAQLRASNLSVSLATAPLPTDAATATNQAATNTTLNSINTKMPTLVGGRVPVDLSAASIQVTGAYLEDLVSSVESLSGLLRNTVGYLLPDSGGRVRALLDTNSNISTVSTVSGVSSVTTLSNQTSVGGYFANDQIPSLINMTAATVRANIISN